MTPLTRVRRFAPAIFMAVFVLALGACGGDYPNSTFNHHTEFNTLIDGLWDKLLFWGTLVFIFVEGILIYTIIRFRKRPNSPPPQHVHGNTTLEIAWTVLPMVILVIIAIPTVRTIFITQAPAPSGSLEVEVIGHQWWWEFKYPQYKFSTANELYLPVGRTVNFKLNTLDVLHSFWVPQLGGKRDLITNRTNHLWYTPNADIAGSVWNGFCTEYCGTSHANMRIRAYTVTPEQFDGWVAGQQAPVVFAPPPPPPAATSPALPGSANSTAAPPISPPAPKGGTKAIPVPKTATLPPASAAAKGAAQAPVPVAAAAWFFPADKLPEYVKPKTPYPDGLEFDNSLLAGGDAGRGQELFEKKGMCGSCHFIATTAQAVGMMMTLTGPNITHVATRHVIAAGLYPNDAEHLARWIKNARKMKPGVLMYTLGLNEIDPQTKQPTIYGKLDDHEIADLVAYLQKLK